MNSVGTKWDGLSLEIGLTASSLAEFNQYVAYIQTVASMCWPQPKDETEQPTLFADPGDNYALREQKAVEWRERQGLR